MATAGVLPLPPVRSAQARRDLALERAEERRQSLREEAAEETSDPLALQVRRFSRFYQLRREEADVEGEEEEDAGEHPADGAE